MLESPGPVKEPTLKECIERLETLFKAYQNDSEFNYQLSSPNSPFNILKEAIYSIASDSEEEVIEDETYDPFTSPSPVVSIDTPEGRKLWEDLHKEKTKIRVVKYNSECIEFDNGYKITFDHDQDCCEYNYADFNQLEDTGIEKEVFDSDLKFEETAHGFRFGNLGKMYYIPCYSCQNGYYTCDVDIYYNGILVLSTIREWIDGERIN